MSRSAVAATLLLSLASPSGPARAEGPFLRTELLGGRLEIPVSFAVRGEGVSSFPVDRELQPFQAGLAASPVLRLGLRFVLDAPLGEHSQLVLEYEQDLPTGTFSAETVAGEGLPNSAELETQLRKAWGRLSYGPLHVGGGLMTGHWGLGLVANDGAHGWEPGSARFQDPRGGDLVLRGFVASGPLTDAHAMFTASVDAVRQDDTLVEGDSALQLSASALVGYDRPTRAGLLFVHRRQSSEDGRYLHAYLIDLTGRLAIDLDGAELTLEAEGALTLGKTDFGGSREIPDLDVLQLGAVVRAGLAFDRFGGVLDLVFASGEPNTYDARATGFRADSNFETGLLLFRYVQAAQTGRGYATGADPLLVGAPPAGIERWPTRGGLTNALVAFPRLWVRPLVDLEAYGGVLLAWAPETNIDPFNTNVGGGTRRNALGREPGSYWGTELDLGLRYHLPLDPVELALGAEGGVLLPGSALGDSTPVYGARAMMSVRL